MNLEQVNAYLEIFSRPGFVCGRMIDDEPGVFPYAVYCEEAEEFLKTCRECGLVVEVPRGKRSKWDALSAMFDEKPELMAEASKEELIAYFTMIMEIEDLNPGMMFFQFENGNITAMLERLRDLLEEQTIP